MEIKRFVLSAISVNSYVLIKGDKAVVIDVGLEPQDLLSFLEERKLKLQAVLITHGHFDHIGGLDELLAKYPAPVYIHELEMTWLTDPALNGSSHFPFFGDVRLASQAEGLHGDSKLKVGDFVFDVIHTPGHSPGGLTYKIDDYLFTGDTLFKESIGRTDFTGGNHSEILSSINDKLFLFPEDYVVFPGHGEASTLEHEKVFNPYLVDFNSL